MNWTPIVLPLFLGACGLTGTGTAISDFAKSEGARAYDAGLANAEFFVCRAASVGSVQRRYGRSVELAEAWRTLCLDNSDAQIIVPVDDSEVP